MVVIRKAPETPTATATTETPKPAEASAPKKRGRKPGQKVEPRDFSTLDLGVLAAPVRAEIAERARVAPQRTRSEQQKVIDGIVEKVYAEWVAVGKPEKWAAMPVMKYHVAPDDAEKLKYLIRRGAEFIGRRARFGTPARDDDGREIVSFVILDKNERGNGGASDAE